MGFGAIVTLPYSSWVSFRGCSKLGLDCSGLSTRRAVTACLVVLVENGIVGKSHRNKQVETAAKNNSKVDATGEDGGFDFNLCARNIC